MVAAAASAAVLLRVALQRCAGRSQGHSACSSQRYWLSYAPAPQAHPLQLSTRLAPAHSLHAASWKSGEQSAARARLFTQRRANRTLSSAVHAAIGRGTIAMDVTRENFEEVFPAVREAVNACEFVAIDTEFTGLGLSPSRKVDALTDALEDRYLRIAESARNFLIIQFGLSAFTWDSTLNRYIARTWNFYTFPRPAYGFDLCFTSQASSLNFLMSQGFDFNKWVRDGVSFLPIEYKDRVVRSLLEPRQRQAVVIKDRDKEFVEGVLQTVTAWLQSPEQQELTLGPYNGFQRLLVYQELESAFNSTKFIVEKLEGHSRDVQMKLIRATPAEIEAYEVGLDCHFACLHLQQPTQLLQINKLQQKKQDLHEAEGFTRVIRMLASSKKPVVGHNMLLDLSYTLHQFLRPLPQSYEDFKQQVAWTFRGGVFDTKYLASQLPDDFFQNGTGLGVIYRQFYQPSPSSGDSIEPEAVKQVVPLVQHAQGFNRYAGDAAYEHEAGYDAYITGCVFAELARLLFSKQQASTGAASQSRLSAVAAFINRVNVHDSDIPYLNLQGQDPQPDRSRVLYVSDLPQQADIVALFSEAGLGGVLVKWLDENRRTAFVVLQDPSKAAGAMEALRASGFPGQIFLYQQGRAILQGTPPELVAQTMQAVAAPDSVDTVSVTASEAADSEHGKRCIVQ
eukprot:jgi/Chlat1/1849/Chrsp141S02188